MNIDDDILFNVLLDFQKRNIDPVSKSLFIKQVLIKLNISERELSKRLNIPHSTVNDWVSLRQYNKSKSTNNSVFFYADRLVFLLTKSKYNVDDKTKQKLMVLRDELQKIF